MRENSIQFVDKRADDRLLRDCLMDFIKDSRKKKSCYICPNFSPVKYCSAYSICTATIYVTHEQIGLI